MLRGALSCLRRYSWKQQLSALSPLDGRYAQDLKDLPNGLDRLEFQLKTEYDWACHLGSALNRPVKPRPWDFSEELLQSFAKHERRTRHDVKSMELAVAQHFFEDKDRWAVHFGLTSEDINGFGNGFLLTRLHRILGQEVRRVISELQRLQSMTAHPVLARTHGQPAIPVSFSYRYQVLIGNLERLLDLIPIPNQVKFGGAIGNFDDAQMATYLVMGVNFEDIVETFEPFATGEFVREQGFQTCLYGSLADHFNSVANLTNGLIKVADDHWDHYSRDLLRIQLPEGWWDLR